MKKTFIVLLCILTTMAFFSSALAITRDSKQSDSDKKEKPVESKEKNKDRTKITQKSKIGTYSAKAVRGSENSPKATTEKSEKTKARSEKEKSKERYDYFMDKNNNGIDDRLERKEEGKSTKKKEVVIKRAPVSKEKKEPAKISPPVKTSVKVKEAKVNQPKKETTLKKVEEKKTKDKR